jgi:predicted TIM-barrel fold metal-dependent hydrolase
MRWQDIPSERYLSAALALSAEECDRLQAALAVLPESIIDAHTHIARSQDVGALSAELLGHVVSTFPVYSLEMADAAKRVLWPGKQVRSARMAHALTGYRHAAINDHLQSDLPAADFLVGFGLASAPSDVGRLLSSGGVAALKMYFHSVDPPLRTVAEVFPGSVLRAAEAEGVPIILHLPTSLPDGLGEVLDVAIRHPLLTIILAHLGGHGGQTLTQELPAAFHAIAEVPTVFLDTAFVLDRSLVRAAVQALGPSRILFGTDEPLSLVRATAYVHPQLGPRLYAPGYHWSRDDGAPNEVIGQAPTLLHIQILEAIIEAVDGHRPSLQAIFHDNGLRLFRRGGHST